MIPKIIEFSVRNRWLVIFAWLGVAAWGAYALLHTPVDAIPDLSENQVIVFTDWMGRSPQDIEEQITYPLSVQLQGLAGVKTVRGSSEFNFSMINVIFDEKTDFYFARERVLEKLTTAKAQLPADVTPNMAPDATALGQIFWYTVEGGGKSLDELRAIQDFTVRYALSSVPGVAEVASVGGFVREYQVDVDPAKLRAYDLPLSAVSTAVAQSNMSVGGKVVVQNSSEYLIRGIGWLKGVDDLEKVVVSSRGGVAISLKQVARVQLGPAFRRSALEKDGREAVGGVVMMRFGQNPLAVTEAIDRRIRDIQSGLPAGVRIVPFYERTGLIHSAIHTVTATLREEMIIASLAILLILAHLRSAIVVCVTLPMAVLSSFLLMYYLNIPSNIMSLSGIAISIGILVDASVVMVENATHELKLKFGNEKVHGDTTEVIIRACRLVGGPIFSAVLIMLLSFLPVFAFGGQAGKLSHPLAFTKSFAMCGVALMAITLVPALIPLFIKGRLSSEEQNPIVRSFINIYKPMLTWAIDRPLIVWWLMAVILSLGAAFIGNPLLSRIVLAFGLLLVLLAAFKFRISNFKFSRLLAALVTLIALALIADTRFRKLGSEFMPELDEGSIMDMPLTAPRVAMGQAVDDVTVRDRLLRSFPEVEQVVGKIGRAETATDPAPTDMVETTVSLRPRDFWPRRKLTFDDTLKQAVIVAKAMTDRGWLKPADWDQAAKAVDDAGLASRKPALGPAVEVLNRSTQLTLDRLDAAARDLAHRRQQEYEPDLTRQLVAAAWDDLRAHVRTLAPLKGRAALVDPDASIRLDAPAISDLGSHLALLPRQEDADRLVALLRDQAVTAGVFAPRDDLLLDNPSPARQAFDAARRAIGVEPPALTERVYAHLVELRTKLWQERTKKLNWEIFDESARMTNDLLLEELPKTAHGTPLFAADPPAGDWQKLSAGLTPRFARGLMLWQKTRKDLIDEMNGELQMPGWGNVWTQPIINRVNMLATGVRTQVGIKVFGPANKPLGGDQGAVAEVQRVADEIARRLDPKRNEQGGVNGADDVQAEQSRGKRYVEITIDREKAGRYGVNMAELAEAIETSMGGTQLTMTVEGRERFPVRLRYVREAWQDVDAIRNVLITANTTAAKLLSDDRRATGAPMSASPMPATPAGSSSGGGMGGGGSSPAARPAAQPGGGAAPMESASAASPSQVVLIPLAAVADVRVVEGPSMIKSENGRLLTYVTLNVRGRDLLGFVAEAREAIKPIEARLAGTGMNVEWSGEFENVGRMLQTLVLIVPLVLVSIIALLFLTFHDMKEVGLVLLAVVGALAGSVMFQAAFGFNMSIIVAIGYIAAFGMATQTAVIMLVYLKEAISNRGGLAGIASLDELRHAVITGAVHRLRPKLLTEGVAIVGLVPMLWACGTGAEIMRPMAAPVLGGLLISDEVIDLMIPVVFYWMQRARWLRLHRRVDVEPVAVRELAPVAL